MLYPFKFSPIYKTRAWGGNTIYNNFLEDAPSDSNIGEAWLLSGLEDDMTEVSNGFLEENAINELTEVYMGEIVGDKVYDKFGHEFPVLVKLIDAKERLSVQVHPNNELAASRHSAYGKSELWYVIDSSEDGVLYIGFKKGVTKDKYLAALESGNIEELLNRVKVTKGDIYYIPAGTVHSIGAGVMIAEIQQTSDITYRIFDWNRKSSEGEPRSLHTELALGAINFDFTEVKNLRIDNPTANTATPIDTNDYFKTSIMDIDGVMDLDYGSRDSFTILLCLEGSGEIEYDTDALDTINKGELILIPSELEEMNLSGKMRLIEVHV